MEGNVVFRQGERTIYAQRMYYDVRRQTGTVLAAEILTPVPKFEGLMKLRAEVVQQVGPDRFVAQNASLTSSRMGIPGYELRSSIDDLSRTSSIRGSTCSPACRRSIRARAPIIDHEKIGDEPQQRRLHRAVPGLLLARDRHGHGAAELTTSTRSA